METSVPTVSETAPIDNALDSFKTSGARVLYTVDKDGVLTGVITPSDITKLNQDPRPQTARDLATTEKIIGIKKDAELWQLIRIMNGENAIDKKFDQVPVLDEKNRPIGIVKRDNLRDVLSTVQIPLKA